MKRGLFALVAIVLIYVSACTTIQMSAENLAVDLLSDESTFYITLKPQELDPAATTTLLSIIMPSINKEQQDAMKRIDSIIAGISISNLKNINIDAIVKGDFPSLNLLIKLDKSGNWKKMNDTWYNMSNNYYISEPSPGIFFIRNNTPISAKATKNKTKFESFITFLMSKSLSVGIYSLKDFSKTVLNTNSDEIPIQTISASFTKNQNAYDFSLTLGYADKKTAEENSLLSRTIVFIAITTAFQKNASKIISKLEWTIDEAGHAISTYKGLSLNEMSTIFNSSSITNLESILEN